MKQVCAIIPIYGFSDMTKHCVELVRKNAGMDIDILVVDDCSKIPYKDSTVDILRLNENLGYTKATNKGILHCGDTYKYLHLLNNDIIPEPDFIKILYDHMESNPSTGIAGSIRWDKDNGKKIYLVHGIDILSGSQGIFFSLENKPDISYCDCFPICSATIRMEMVREIGILDKQFRNHCSDVDYCIRANQNNWKVAVLTKSVVEHKHQITTRHMRIDPYDDQKKFIAKIAGMEYQKLMNRLPLDNSINTWGRMTFERYKINDNANQFAAA